MQIAYQTQVSDVKARLGVTSPNILPPVANLPQGQHQIYNQDFGIVKSENENYNFKRIFSPFLSPSNAVVSDKISLEKSVEPVFLHNEARTRYFIVSKPAKSTDHLKINLLA